MIYEFIEDDEQITLQDFESLTAFYNRLCLPVPLVNEVMQARGEYNINHFLNEYGMVLKLYRYNCTQDKNKPDAHLSNGDFHMTDHMYHESILPYIACIRYPYFTALLMPAVFLSKQFYTAEFTELFKKDLGSNVDICNENTGFECNTKRNLTDAVSLDTIHHPLEAHKYGTYLTEKQGVILKSYERYDQAQRSFAKAWANSIDDKAAMKDFWVDARTFKQRTGLLNANWLDEEAFKGQGLYDEETRGIPAGALRYHERVLSSPDLSFC